MVVIIIFSYTTLNQLDLILVQLSNTCDFVSYAINTVPVRTKPGTDGAALRMYKYGLATTCPGTFFVLIMRRVLAFKTRPGIGDR